MKHFLIADAGSTKTDWILVSRSDGTDLRFSTGGINAALASDEEIAARLAEAASLASPNAGIDRIWYYGAGCASPEICARMERMLSQAFSCPDVSASSDLAGTARALLGDKPGIACILGTGSNSCLYDGSEIVANVPSLGYILGDEGSGSALGRRLVSDIFKHCLPEEAERRFFDKHPLSVAEVIKNVYREPFANRYLASFAPFLRENMDLPCLRSLVKEEFERFFVRNVARYPDSRSVSVSFTGSVALHFEDILREAASDCGFTVGQVVKNPASLLARYHIMQN